MSNYLNDFAQQHLGKLYHCYDGDPIAPTHIRASIFFHTKVDNGKESRFHPNHGCCKCEPPSEVGHQDQTEEIEHQLLGIKSVSKNKTTRAKTQLSFLQGKPECDNHSFFS